jgi:hypothetical protein
VVWEPGSQLGWLGACGNRFGRVFLLLEWPSAGEECVNFAKKHNMFSSGGTVKAMSSWIKRGKVVVELAAFRGNEANFVSRICTVGGGYITIVSILEENTWR